MLLIKITKGHVYQCCQKLQGSKEHHFYNFLVHYLSLQHLRKDILRCSFNFQQIRHFYKSTENFTENVYNTDILKHVKLSKDWFWEKKTHKISVYFVFHGIASVENSWYSVKREKLNLDSSIHEHGNVYIIFVYSCSYKYFVMYDKTDTWGISQRFFSLYIFSYHLIFPIFLCWNIYSVCLYFPKKIQYIKVFS